MRMLYDDEVRDPLPVVSAAFHSPTLAVLVKCDGLHPARLHMRTGADPADTQFRLEHEDAAVSQAFIDSGSAEWSAVIEAFSSGKLLRVKIPQCAGLAVTAPDPDPYGEDEDEDRLRHAVTGRAAGDVTIRRNAPVTGTDVQVTPGRSGGPGFVEVAIETEHGPRRYRFSPQTADELRRALGGTD